MSIFRIYDKTRNIAEHNENKPNHNEKLPRPSQEKGYYQITEDTECVPGRGQDPLAQRRQAHTRSAGIVENGVKLFQKLNTQLPRYSRVCTREGRQLHLLASHSTNSWKLPTVHQ